MYEGIHKYMWYSVPMLVFNVKPVIQSKLCINTICYWEAGRGVITPKTLLLSLEGVRIFNYLPYF